VNTLAKAATLGRRSLRARLMVLLMPALVIITLVEFTLSYRLAQRTIDEAYDRSLQGAVQALSLATRYDDTGFAVDKPFKLLSYVQSHSRGTVFFHVRTSDGLMSAGFAGLDFPWPAQAPLDEVLLGEGSYFEQHLRMAAMRREVAPASANQPALYVELLVAEDLAPRLAYLRGFALQTALRDGVLLLLTSLILVWIVRNGLAPLKEWSQLVKSQSGDNLAPLPLNQSLPDEARPLVEALNFHISRSQQQQRQHQQFLDNASHQLRTPLAVLKTHIAWAREQYKDNAALAVFLPKFEAQVDTATQHANQMLQLARLEGTGAGTVRARATPVIAAARDALMALQPLARARAIDAGLRCEAGVSADTCVWIDTNLLRQVLENLLDNAIKYGRANGHVTVVLSRTHTNTEVPEQLCICVENDGDVIDADTFAHMGERFYQADQQSKWGAGLGLSIVKLILDKAGSSIHFTPNANAQGLRATFCLPVTERAAQPAIDATHKA
jgi:two-component system, OmpR family, sensor histidine kinase TctE